jgi:hypothetical protein
VLLRKSGPAIGIQPFFVFKLDPSSQHHHSAACGGHAWVHEGRREVGPAAVRRLDLPLPHLSFWFDSAPLLRQYSLESRARRVCASIVRALRLKPNPYHLTLRGR